jgi:hypothetical protein
LWRGRSEPKVGRGGDSSEVEAESEPGGRARRRPSSEVEVESEPWGRARRRPSSGVEVESEPWGRARRRFLWRPRLGLAAVSFTLASGTTVGAAGGAVFLSGQSVEGRSDCGHFGLVDWKARVRIRCQAFLALNAPAIRSAGEAIWLRLLLAKPARAGPRTSRRCARCLRRPSGETRICLGLPFLPEAGLGRGEIMSLEWTEPSPELRSSGICSFVLIGVTS